ncbi:gamma-butyrobetaine dioxygenase [Genypterus blacodes]|uniref:gamma-butyrobetaine dioxygenase n=1 Tax=Genypterus blacodes TaxID=154954 RepID=UPI003F761BAE
MWMSKLARFAQPALQRSTSAVGCRRVWTRGGPGLTAAAHPASCLTSVQHRGHQTVVSASIPKTGHGVRHALALDEERLVEVEWEDGGQSLYPFSWLRDNCQCPLCFLRSAQARRLYLLDVDIHTGVDVVQVTDDNKVSIVWPDQHTSVFDAEWLRKRCFSPAARKTMQEELFINERYYWDCKLHLPTADFNEVLHDDKAALAWLTSLRRVGVVYLRGAPAEQGQLDKLEERLGFLKMTFYGRLWLVQDKPQPNNLAYTSGRFHHHTDYPALPSTPGIQLLHCINPAAEGGESEIVDGFHAALQLLAEDPKAYQILTSVLVDYKDTGADYCEYMLNARKHTISVDQEGRVSGINLNNATRGSVLDLPVQEVQPFYRALRAYVDIMNRPENVVTFQMQAGDLVTFDNTRILHGRKSFISFPDRPRLLEGAYMDWDVVLSRLRVLRKSVQGDI